MIHDASTSAGLKPSSSILLGSESLEFMNNFECEDLGLKNAVESSWCNEN